MIILLIIAACLFVFAFVQIIRALILLSKAVYYRFFANENQVDEGFKKHVIKNTDEYKAFEKGFDKSIDGLINPKKFEL